jgi:hypothetical protein
VSCPLYWVQIAPRTVVSLRGLRVYCGDRESPPDIASPASRLVIEPGIIFDLDERQDAIVWDAVRKVYAAEAVIPTIGPADAGLPESDHPAAPDDADASAVPGPDAEPAVVRSVHPARPDPPPAVGDPGIVPQGDLSVGHPASGE